MCGRFFPPSANAVAATCLPMCPSTTRARRNAHAAAAVVYPRARIRISVCATVLIGGYRRRPCSNHIRHFNINPRGCCVFAYLFYEFYKNLFSFS
jgi:hypothetical protein